MSGIIASGGNWRMGPSETVRLREALRVQWEWNHAEHCSNEWPHPEGETCHWPLPVELDGQADEYRTYGCHAESTSSPADNDAPSQ